MIDYLMPQIREKPQVTLERVYKVKLSTSDSSNAAVLCYYSDSCEAAAGHSAVRSQRSTVLKRSVFIVYQVFNSVPFSVSSL